MTTQSEDFEKLVNDAGIPSTEAALKTEWQTVATGAGLAINNDSTYSPFWRAITGLVTTPVLWFITFLIEQVLPNSFLKTAKDIYLDIIAWGYGLTRKLAQKAQGNLEFTRADNSGQLVVLAGFVVQSAAVNGNIYSLATTAEYTFLDGESVASIAVEALDVSDNYNLAAGYYSVMEEPLAGVTVTNLVDWLVVPGTDKESDDNLRDRCRNQFSSVNQWHTNSVYSAIIAQLEGTSVQHIYFDQAAPRGPGTATAYVMLEIGTVSQAYLDAANDLIMGQGNHGLGDDLLVAPIPETLHDITFDYYEVDNLIAADSAKLATDLDYFIRAAFREHQEYTPTLVTPYERFSFSRLSQELHTAFSNLDSIRFDNADIDAGLELLKLNSLVGTKL